MTTRLPQTIGLALVTSAALLVVLACVHQALIESTVFFYDDLGNEVDYVAGRDVTFLIFCLAGVALVNGGAVLWAMRASRD